MELQGSYEVNSDIRENLARLNERLAGVCNRSGRHTSDIRVIAVTKSRGPSLIRAAYDCGVRDFAENRVQEAKSKYPELTEMRPDIKLHMVGHLQSNKTGEAVQLFDIIHSVDSIKLASLLNERVAGPLDILLQVNVAGEETKSGFSIEEVAPALEKIGSMSGLHVKGLMTIAPIAVDPGDVRHVFSKLRKLKERFGLFELSMGMTDDYEVAVEEGSTMIRIGRAIFGEGRQL